MGIQTKEDWIETAKVVVPLLPEYMAEESGQVDPGMVETELTKHMEAEDWPMLHQRLNEIWAWLPDRPSIHRRPFSQLCDLCSEFWVFEE